MNRFLNQNIGDIVHDIGAIRLPRFVFVWLFALLLAAPVVIGVIQVYRWHTSEELQYPLMNVPPTPPAKPLTAEEQARGGKPDDMTIRVAIRGYAREHFNSGHVEVLGILGEPVAEGSYWSVLAKVRSENAYGGKIVKVVNFYMQGGDVVFIRE